MRRVTSLLLIVLPVLAIHFVVAEEAVDKSPVGRQIPGFELHDYLGAAYRLDAWADKKALVVVFLGDECPIAKLVGPHLAELALNYKDKGVAFVGIDANQQDSLVDIARYASRHKITFPILKDAGNVVADLFGAKRTPDAFVLDSDRVIRYRGMISNQFGVGYARAAATQNYLVDALEAVLAGKPVPVAATEPVGCFIGRVHREVTDNGVTFAKDVAPIFNEHCVTCHRDGQAGPFVLTNYADAAGWGETIAEVVRNGRMPPWHANPEYGHFQNDVRLSEKEKQLIVAWVRAGCPEGNTADLPEPPKFTEGWRIPKPELVVKMAKPFEIPERGVVDYQNFELTSEFPEERWVLAAEVRPGNRAVTHHMVLFFHPADQEEVDPREALLNKIAGYAPGTPPTIYSSDACRRIPPGSKLMVQAHYTPNGSPQIDQSEVGLVFANPKQVKKEIELTAAINFFLSIPAGANNYVVEANCRFEEDTLLYSLAPHMHLRGKAFQFVANYPDGSKEILLDVPRYDFNWQNSYTFVEPKPLPDGTEIQCLCAFDNSAENPVNPDPTIDVSWGEQTWQEMAVGAMEISSQEQDFRLGPPKVTQLADGRYEAQFTYKPTSKADKIYLTGDFNEWRTDGELMIGPDKEGRYTTTLTLAAGEYQYKFVLDGTHFRADPGNPARVSPLPVSLLQLGGKK